MRRGGGGRRIPGKLACASTPSPDTTRIDISGGRYCLQACLESRIGSGYETVLCILNKWAMMEKFYPYVEVFNPLFSNIIDARNVTTVVSPVSKREVSNWKRAGNKLYCINTIEKFLPTVIVDARMGLVSNVLVQEAPLIEVPEVLHIF